MRFAFVLVACLIPAAGHAGQGDATAGSVSIPSVQQELPFAFDGAPAPVPPAVVSRDPSGRVTIRVVKLSAPLRIDGRLDEPLYTTVPSISDFIQVEPQEGMPATERTEVWVSYDDDNIYVSFRCWETHPERVVANEMRRDNTAIFQGNDHIAFMFDTFYDRRNSVLFEFNPIGGRLDGQVTNERQFNGDWNPVWDLEPGRFEGGWTIEVAVPFKSLRYRAGRGQIWGFNVRRGNRWKNETSFLTHIPNALGDRGIFQASLAATLVGLEAPPGSKNIEIKPYVVSNVTTDRLAVPRVSNDLDGDFGLDVKYGVTQNLTADFTYNTDFAQVEADEQQINLTRFSLFFPEKREFFLENLGLYGFGGVSPGASGDTPILFYSRRIGLNRNRIVPIDVGGRLTGRLGRYSIGLLDIRTGDEPASLARATNFSVVRVKRDIWRRSSIGVLYTGRAIAQLGEGRNVVYGADGTFAFFDNLAINTYWAQTKTDGVSGDDISYRAQLDYAGDRYGVQAERLVVGDNFNPEVGFVRRDDMRKTFGAFRFSPRPMNIPSIRKFSWVGSMVYIENGSGRLETREAAGEFGIEFQSSDRFGVAFIDTFEFLPRPFPITPDITIPVGDYDFEGMRVGYTFGQQRPVSGSVTVEHGTFYDGRRTAIGVSRGRLNVTPQFSVEPSYSVNWVDLPEGAFTTQLLGSRVTYTMTPQMFTSALVQFNSANHVVSANVRLRWEYQPGSEFFVVYNEERDTFGPRFPELANRSLIVKINRLFRF
jgi:hypothetical protein